MNSFPENPIVATVRISDGSIKNHHLLDKDQYIALCLTVSTGGNAMQFLKNLTTLKNNHEKPNLSE